MTVHLCIPDVHSKPGDDNQRATWIGELIKDIKPDVVINGGDMFDMYSLCSYDKGKGSFVGRSYKADIDAGLDFDEKLWAPLRKARRKMPRKVFLEGNHEYRLKRLLEYESILDGTVGFKDFQLNRNYDDIVEYHGSTPGIITIDGISYAHYFISGVKGNPLSGVSPARALLQKMHVSCTSFHLHLADWSMETTAEGRKIMGMFAGVGHDRFESFAGAANALWYPCVVVKNNVHDGCYEPQFISLDTLRREYG